MNTMTYEHPKKRNATLHKKLFILSMIIAGSFVVNSAYSQVHVDVAIGAPAPVIYERDYPGYVYYTYPAWRGHYRDRVYYSHYRPIFERNHRAYFNGRRFDHARFEREKNWRGGRGPGRGNQRGHEVRHDNRHDNGHDNHRH